MSETTNNYLFSFFAPKMLYDKIIERSIYSFPLTNEDDGHIVIFSKCV